MSSYVISHKKIVKRLPKDRHLMLVGAEDKDFKFDYNDNDINDNISQKNKSYCELTGLYMIWKNSNDKNVGLEHYRRLFYHPLLSLFSYKYYSIKKMDKILTNYDVILPEKSFMCKQGEKRFENVYDQYSKEHYKKDIDSVKKIIENDYPDYVESFNKVMNSRTMSKYNMFYMSKDKTNLYCEWIFNILFKLESIIDISSYDNYQARVFGFLSERLFNVWVLKNNLRIKYLPVCNNESNPIKQFIFKNLRKFAFWRK